MRPMRISLQPLLTQPHPDRPYEFETTLEPTLITTDIVTMGPDHPLPVSVGLP